MAINKIFCNNGYFKIKQLESCWISKKMPPKNIRAYMWEQLRWFELWIISILTCKGTKLEITVEPEQVRLIPTADDSYAWRIVPEKEHFFRKEILNKHLSKHSIGAYRHLYRAIGESLEAVFSSGSHSAVKEANETNMVNVNIQFCIWMRLNAWAEWFNTGERFQYTY